MRMSPFGRLLLSLLILMAAAMAAAWPAMVVQLTFLLLLLRRLAPNKLWQGWRLLRWLLLPMLLLHLLFTPGEWLLPNLAWSPSREGVAQALHLSLRLSLLFAAALLLPVLVRREEWLHLAAATPLFGRRLLLLLTLLQCMGQPVRFLIAHHFQHWRLRRRWRDLGEVVAALLISVLRMGERVADQYWLREAEHPPLRIYLDPLSGVAIVCAAGWLWVVA